MYVDTTAGLSGWGCARNAGLTDIISINLAITMAKEPSVTSSVSSTPSDSGLSQPTVTSVKSNVGAIAGGAVGGLAVVVLGCAGLFVGLSLRRRKTAAATAPGLTVCQHDASPAQPMFQQLPMQPMYPGSYPDQNWNNQVYAPAAQPQVIPQQQSHQAKFADSEVTAPASGTLQYGTQPPQQQGYYSQQPQQPQQLAAPPRAELSDRQ